MPLTVDWTINELENMSVEIKQMRHWEKKVKKTECSAAGRVLPYQGRKPWVQCSTLHNRV